MFTDMSRFQSTISTFAALATIAVTTVTLCRACESQKVYNPEWEAKMQKLREKVKQHDDEIVPTPLLQELIPDWQKTVTDPTKEGSAQVPPPLPQQ